MGVQPACTLTWVKIQIIHIQIHSLLSGGHGGAEPYPAEPAFPDPIDRTSSQEKTNLIKS